MAEDINEATLPKKGAKSDQQKITRWKAFKFFCFLGYTYCIYQSYLFSICATSLVMRWDKLSWSLVERALELFLIIPAIFIDIILHPWLLLELPIQGFLVMLLIITIYAYIFALWWRHTSVYTASLVALTGQIAGPGVMFLFGVPGDGGHGPGVWQGMVGVEIFYISLIIVNLFQQIFFPTNKIAICVRKILAWPRKME